MGLSESGSPAGTAITPALMQLYRSGQYIRTPGTRSTLAFATNGLWTGVPVVVPKGKQVDALAIRTTVAAAANGVVRVGLYKATTNGLPDANGLIAGTEAVIDATPSAGVLESVLAAPVTLPTELVWAIAACQGAPATRPTVRSLGSTSHVLVPDVGANILDNDGNPGITGTGVTGALPATLTITSTTGNPALVALRLA